MSAPALLFLAIVVAVPIFSTFKLSFEELETRRGTTSFVQSWPTISALIHDPGVLGKLPQ